MSQPTNSLCKYCRFFDPSDYIHRISFQTQPIAVINLLLNYFKLTYKYIYICIYNHCCVRDNPYIYISLITECIFHIIKMLVIYKFDVAVAMVPVLSLGAVKPAVLT